MSETTRRHACRSAALLLAGVSVAGCSSGSESSDVLAPDESVSLGGLEVTYTDYETVDEILPTTPADEAERETSTPSSQSGSTRTDTTTTPGDRATPMTGSEDESILGVEFRIRNGADEEKNTPMPAPAPVMASGEISIEIDAARYRQRDAPSLRVGPRAEVDGTTLDGLGYRLGQRQASLSPDEEVAGWAFYPLPTDPDLSDVRVVISGVEFEMDNGATMIEWRLVDA